MSITTPSKSPLVISLEERVNAVRASKVVQLPLWRDSSRSIPNEVVRSALFKAQKNGTPRRYYADESILVVGDGAISYRGEELRVDDEDVWLQILHLARLQPLGECVEFTAYSFLKELGWANTPYYYDKLKTAISRLKATSVTVESKRLGRALGLSLVKRFEWQASDSSRKKVWRIWIEPEMRVLFGEHYYTIIEWKQRQRLSPIAKRLYDYYSSHRRPYPLKLRTLQDLCGSTTATTRKLRQQIRKALDEVKATGLLVPSLPNQDWIDSNDLVHVARSTGSRS
ncbi:hypothetical protein CAI21_21960 [Alkalilimnicola ehrlichii]|uniref:TrfA family protein n=1 Tax=Alkalilimnicola ehrlichii TaxID=351052 RepID=A0A3E0WF91_9GAMM|nr:plasmid replication initiator TrfA [Alkalilimnicola ehrlichii]RFA24376.1 hypothetical protein CAI21_21960 [Alkalilimnicola ehrlichii]RFA31614.1 hypothetical protein CAL65_21965 [Alkalilimnicola ehrlichii]